MLAAFGLPISGDQRTKDGVEQRFIFERITFRKKASLLRSSCFADLRPPPGIKEGGALRPRLEVNTRIAFRARNSP